MSSLKRSQKLCPKCGKINFIRQFSCKFCNYEFPKRDKSLFQNSSIEQFFFKMPLNVENTNKKKDNDNSAKIKKEIEPIRSRSESRIKERYGDKQELTFNKNEIIEINKTKLDQFFKLLEKKGIINNIFIEKNMNLEKYIKINNELNVNKWKVNSILFPSASIFPPLSFDICTIDGINSYFISALFREENQINILTNVIIKFNKDNANQKIKIFQNECKEETEETKKLLYNQNINTKIISCNEDYLLYSLTYKNILQCNIIKSFQNSQNNLEIFKISSKNLIIETDFNLFQSKNQIRILLSNVENTIFYYLYEISDDNPKPEKVKLIGIYDFLFLYKITNIKFLDVKGMPDSSSENFFFMASSRDGFLYILNNLGYIIFQHKTNQTWITQCIYDSYHNILLFLTNFDDKIIGAKFNVNKDPIIKRIPNTNNPYCIQMTPFMDRIFYLDNNDSIYCLSTFIIEDMFKASKLKKRSDYKPVFVYKLDDKDNNMFLNKFKLIGNNKSVSCDKNDKSIILTLFYNKEIKFVYI